MLSIPSLLITPTTLHNHCIKSDSPSEAFSLSKIFLLEWSSKNLDFVASHLFFLICIGYRFATELVLKLLRLLLGCYNFQQPSYLASLIPEYVPTQALHSSSSLSICVHPRKTVIANSKSFSSVASNIWNALPNHLSSISALPALRRALKNHLFLLAYPDSGAKSGKIKPAQFLIAKCCMTTNWNVNAWIPKCGWNMGHMGQFAKIWDNMGHFLEIWDIWDIWDSWEACDNFTRVNSAP